MVIDVIVVIGCYSGYSVVVDMVVIDVIVVIVDIVL